MTNSSVPPELARVVALTLRVGIVLAAILLLFGLGLNLVEGAANLQASGSRVSLASLPGQVAHFDGVAIILLGILTLLFVPLVRVIVSFGLFARARDPAFTLITAFVFIVLVLSVAVGANP